MWRALFAIISSITLGVLGRHSVGQEARVPYGPFDAVAEGARSSEASRLSLIDSQLETVDYLRSITVPVRAPRVIYSSPRIAAVYSYGRRGLFGLRPQRYVVVRRTPIVVYRPAPPLGPPAPPVEPFGYVYREGVRQPIGHESLQTGPNRWEYRPLYADDNASFDETHRQIEARLGPGRDMPDVPNRLDREGARAAESRSPHSTARPYTDGAHANEPEELPAPPEVPQPRREANQTPSGGGARDIARDQGPSDESKEREEARPPRRTTVPPPPQPDPPVQPDRREVERNAAQEKKREQPKDAAANGDAAEVLGPRLHNPATGTREF